MKVIAYKEDMVLETNGVCAEGMDIEKPGFIIQAIPLAKVKQARDEIENYNVLNNFALNTETFKAGVTRGLDLAVEILDKLIAESET